MPQQQDRDTKPQNTTNSTAVATKPDQVLKQESISASDAVVTASRRDMLAKAHGTALNPAATKDVKVEGNKIIVPAGVGEFTISYTGTDGSRSLDPYVVKPSAISSTFPRHPFERNRDGSVTISVPTSFKATFVIGIHGDQHVVNVGANPQQKPQAALQKTQPPSPLPSELQKKTDPIQSGSTLPMPKQSAAPTPATPPPLPQQAIKAAPPVVTPVDLLNPKDAQAIFNSNENRAQFNQHVSQLFRRVNQGLLADQKIAQTSPEWSGISKEYNSLVADYGKITKNPPRWPTAESERQRVVEIGAQLKTLLDNYDTARSRILAEAPKAAPVPRTLPTQPSPSTINNSATASVDKSSGVNLAPTPVPFKEVKNSFLNQRNFQAEVNAIKDEMRANPETTFVVVFSATRDCPPCRQYEPTVAAAGATIPRGSGVVLRVIDGVTFEGVENLGAGVKSFPSTAVFPGVKDGASTWQGHEHLRISKDFNFDTRAGVLVTGSQSSAVLQGVLNSGVK